MIRLFVRNLSWTLTENDLRTAFEDRGLMVKSCRIPPDKETGQSRGYGFVEVENIGTLQEAQDVMEGVDLGGRQIYVALATPREGFVERPQRPAQRPPMQRERDDYNEPWRRR